MGINRLWEAIPSERLPLGEINNDCLRKNGRPLRIAIDGHALIYHFDEGAGKAQGAVRQNLGTSNVYYFCLKLIEAGVDVIFVTDGPGKPAKLGRLATPTSSIPTSFPSRNASYMQSTNASSSKKHTGIGNVIRQVTEMLSLLGIPLRMAPGEGEAECAAMEKAGLVDAVLTTDSDAFVFGTNVVLRKKKEGDKKNQELMVQRFRTVDLDPALTQEHFLLMALLAGGDYGSGIRKCGTATAFKIARAGQYASHLYALLKDDNSNLHKWREDLIDELRKRGNQMKIVADNITSNFPDRRIAGYYMNPNVSTSDELQRWGGDIDWLKPINVIGLRAFTEQTFDWKYRHHAEKFVRLLAPAACSKALRTRVKCTNTSSPSSSTAALSDLPISIVGEKDSFLRVEFQAFEFVDFDLNCEPINYAKRGNLSLFDSSVSLKQWMPRCLVEKGAPGLFEKWQNESKKGGAISKKPLTGGQVAGQKRGNDGSAGANARKRPRGRSSKKRVENPVPDVTSKSPSPVHVCTLRNPRSDISTNKVIQGNRASASKAQHATGSSFSRPRSNMPPVLDFDDDDENVDDDDLVRLCSELE